MTIEEVMEAGNQGTIETLLLPMEYPLQPLPRLDLPEQFWKLGKNGGKLPSDLMPELEENRHIRVYAEEELLGVAHKTQDLIRFDVGLTGGN